MTLLEFDWSLLLGYTKSPRGNILKSGDNVTSGCRQINTHLRESLLSLQ